MSLQEDLADDPGAELVRPPKALLVQAGLCAAASVLLHLPDGRWADLAGYLLGTFGTILLVAMFRREDARRSASPWYSPEPGLAVAATVILVLGILSSLPHIWHLAEQAPS